ncbi:MAG: peptidoglycan editing factor PgeF [Acidobacteriota bacterium]
MPFRFDERGVYRCADWERLDWLDHGFGTRQSEQWLPEDESADLKQIHSGVIVRAKAPMHRACEGDALVTNTPGLWIRIRTADCLPVLLVDVRKRVVGAAHCGWRGTKLGLAAATLRRMGEEFGSEPADVRAAIGPGIGLCCFEVGGEVAREFRQVFPERADLEGRTKIDLADALQRQLLGIGLPREQIIRSELCTRCEEKLFHSFRRDREAAGRMESGVRIKGTVAPE